MSTRETPFACARVGSAHCQLYCNGHNTHVIHANHVGRSPWGWRDGLVTCIDGQWLTVDYVQEQGRARVWHHQSLTDELSAGQPVRVHEGLHVLGGPFGWLNVIIESGLGAVPEPTEPALWADDVTLGVVDLGSGRALPLDRPDRNAG